MDKFALGERICFIRESGNHSQEELALAVGVTNVTISRYEKGHRTPDAEFLNRLVELYGCDPGWLLTGNGQGPEKPASLVVAKIDLMLEGMDEEAQRDVLKYAEEKKLLADLMAERKHKKTG